MDVTDMTGPSDQNPLDDLQNFLQSFKDKYGENVEVQTDFQPPSSPDSEPEKEAEFSFDHTPREIRRHLDQYVIGQEDAKKHLANAVCYHYHQTRRNEPYDQKKNILMIGNTGVGKTHLVEVLSDFIGVPFVKADATKFSGTGYVGKNVNSLIRELAEKADHNIHRAEHGIVFLDEIDKICSSDSTDRDVSGQDVQTNLLKLLEETEVNLFDPSNPASMMKGMKNVFGAEGDEVDETINTRKILFIVSGAFPELEKQIADRLDRGGVGFTADLESERNLQTLKQCEVQDLVNYGLEAEFVGRLPVRTYLDDLDEEDLYRILTESESSILRQYKQDFLAYDIELNFEEGALREIARRAKQQNIGARGLTTELEQLLFEFMHELPGSSTRTLNITRDMVENPRRTLYRMQLEERLKPTIQEEFGEYGVEVTVTEDGREALLDLAGEQERSPLTLFRERFESLHHILTMIDPDTIRIDRDYVTHHEERLDQLCSEYFQNQQK